MAEALSRQFLAFSIAETSEGKGYWLDRPWVDENQRTGLLAASVLAVPGVRGEDERPVFPEGSEGFIDRLRGLLDANATLAVAIRSADYEELALHSKAWRLPVLFVTYVALPFVIDILASRVDELLPGHKAGDTAEATLIIEGPNHKTLKVTYKGDPKELGEFLNRSVPRFIDELDGPPPPKPHKHHKPHAKPGEG